TSVGQRYAGLSRVRSRGTGDRVTLLAGVSPHPDAIRAVLALVQPGLAQLEAALAALANSDDAVLGPMLSTVLPGSGKRLRPALSLLIGRMGSADREALNHMAVGVELL